MGVCAAGILLALVAALGCLPHLTVLVSNAFLDERYSFVDYSTAINGRDEQ